MNTYENIKNSNTTIEKAKENQKQSKSNLIEIKRGNRKTKSKDQLDTIKNIKNLYEATDEIIKVCNDHAKTMSEAKHKTKYGEGIKKLLNKCFKDYQ